MSGLRDRIERIFETTARAIAHMPVPTVLITLAIFAAMASGVTKLRIDTSNEAFLHANDRTLQRYIEFKAQFGREDAMIVLIDPDSLFSQRTLERIRRLHEDVAANVPHVDEITSLVNARETRGESDELIVGEMLEDWPETPEDLEALRERVMENPLYLGQLVSQDGAQTTLVVTLDVYSDSGDTSTLDALAGFDDPGVGGGEDAILLTDAETRAAVDAMREVVARHRAEGFDLYLAGMPAVTEALKGAVQADMKKFMALALGTIALSLLAMFQRASGVALPLMVVVLSLGSTMGLMGHLGVPVTVITVILPSFMLAVSVGAAIHVLAIFFQAMQDGRDRPSAIAYALGHSGLAIVLTSLTTAAGLGSFATAEVAPIGHLGVFAALGTLVSLLYTIFLLPALLALLPLRTAERRQFHTRHFDRFLAWVARVSTDHAKAITAVSLVVLAVALGSAAQLRLSHDVLAWFPRSWPVREATEKIDHDLRGTVIVEMVIDTGRENGLYDREVLARIETAARETAAYEANGLYVAKTFSVVDILKEIHKALNENRPEFYRIPENAALIPQEFLLFENSGSDDLETVIDSGFRTARVSIRVPWRDALVYTPFLDDTIARFERVFEEHATVTSTGMLDILARTLNAAITSMARSYIVAFAAITAMMMALVGSVRLGALAMIPNLSPIALVMGGMWWLGIPLNLFTMLVGSIAIGLAVDDTVHFMHNFRRYFEETGNHRKAVALTLHTTGRAMLTTSIVLGLGFYIFTFATLNNIVQFGLLTGTAIFLALLADFFLLPALLTLAIPEPKPEPKEVP